MIHMHVFVRASTDVRVCTCMLSAYGSLKRCQYYNQAYV